MKKLFAVILSFVSILCLGNEVFGKSAEITLVPTRIVLENDARYATVVVKNTGDAIGRYRAELVDAVMTPEGGVKVLENGERDQFSAQDIVSISPRSVTLRPDEFQTIRILVKRNDSLQAGEYRSHLKVKMVESDINPETDQPNEESASIALKPKLVMIIPVIVRNGETSFKVDIGDVKLDAPLGLTRPKLDISFLYEGNRSIVGDVKVTHISPDGKESLLKFFPGVAIYRGVTKRGLSLELEIPDGVDFRKGKMIVSYLTQDKDGGKVMAQKETSP